MISTEQIQTLLENGGSVIGENDTKIGAIGQVFLDDTTGNPDWVTVKTGLFGTGESFVPLDKGTVSGNDIVVPFSKDRVKDAPRVDDSNGHLDKSQEAELYAHYSREYSEQTAAAGVPTGTTDETAAPTDETAAPTTDSVMTRSEEQLRVGTEKVESGKARLRKFVVTENVTTTVPVTREEVRIEREPITDANRDEAVSDADITSAEHEMVLTEERVVVQKETVPVERIRMGTETVTENEQVTEEVRKEQVETDTDAVNPRRTGPEL